jgi:hypothetical protein
MLTRKLEKCNYAFIGTGFKQDKPRNPKELLRIITDQYDLAKSNYTRFIEEGLITDDLIVSCLFLAKMDVYFRRRVIDDNLDFHDPKDTGDIKAMLSLVDMNDFKSKNSCYLNPTFGKGSQMVYGADADLIIDDLLIDLKTTKHLRLEREDLNQLLGYYILSLIGGINDTPRVKPIKRIGIYFARYGVLWSAPVDDFGDSKKFRNFKNWFVAYMNRS